MCDRYSGQAVVMAFSLHWQAGLSVAELIIQASQRLFSSHDAGRGAEHLDLDVAVGKELDLPSFARHGDLDHDRFRADLREPVEDLALVQVRKEVEQLLERIHTTVPLFTRPYGLVAPFMLRQGIPTDPPSPRIHPIAPVYSSRSAGSTPPPHHPPSTSSPTRTAAA